MLFIGTDVVLLLIAGAVIAIGVLLVARRFLGLDEASANALSYASMATSGLLVAAYIVIRSVLDSLC